MVMSGAPNLLPGRSEAPEGARFRLLGPIEVGGGDDRIDLGGPLQLALLACLALRPGEVVSRERLIDALWDIDPPAERRAQPGNQDLAATSFLGVGGISRGAWRRLRARGAG